MCHASSLQLANVDTGLTTSTTSITFSQAADAIATLRDSVDGFNSTTTEESDLTRTPTSVSGVTSASSGPLLFAANSNAVAYTRTPSQVSASLKAAAMMQVL